jgi:hypothetical protein
MLTTARRYGNEGLGMDSEGEERRREGEEL